MKKKKKKRGFFCSATWDRMYRLQTSKLVDQEFKDFFFFSTGVKFAVSENNKDPDKTWQRYI